MSDTRANDKAKTEDAETEDAETEDAETEDAETEDVGLITPESDIARDLSRRALYIAPLLVGVSAIFWQFSGAISSGFALVVVVANFLLAAALMGWSARISLPVFMATVLGGYVLRLALIAGAVIAISGQPWFEAIPLGFTLIIAHLGLLAWETRYVSASLAYPGLKPQAADSSAARRRVAAATTSEEE